MTGSWHIPYVPTYPSQDSKEVLHVIFLARCSKKRRSEILEKLNQVDKGALDHFGLDQSVKPRKLLVREWVRDYNGDTRIMQEIARSAFMESKAIHRTVLFVDPNADETVIATCWVGDRGSSDAHLEAESVPHGVANVLLTACEENSTGLSHVLGEEYGRLKVDLDSSGTVLARVDLEPFQWPLCLLQGLALDPAAPTIISLRHLGDEAIAALSERLRQSDKLVKTPIQIYDWEGPELDRTQVLALFKQIRENTPQGDRRLPGYFIDNLLSYGDDLVVLCASWIREIPNVEARGLHLTPMVIDTFFAGWRSRKEDPSKLNVDQNLFDAWREESVYHPREVADLDNLYNCPAIFLRPFTSDQQRRIREALSMICSNEENTDWGKDFLYLGYPWSDATPKTVDDLRDLLETCDTFSPSYDPKSPGPFHFTSYPNNFIAIDDAIFHSDHPKVWLCSGLGFKGANANDRLGWSYGLVAAAEAHLDYSNLSIANMGPEEMFEDGQGEKLWLSDLKAYREKNYRPHGEGAEGDDTQDDD